MTSNASAGISFAHGLPCMSTNIAKKNWIPSASARFLSASRASSIKLPSLCLATITPVTWCHVSSGGYACRPEQHNVRPA
jgi:hypothetical protein